MPRPEFTRGKIIGFVVGVGLLVTALMFRDRLGASQAAAAGITGLMAAWWLSEALPIYWTACVPLILSPLLLPFPGDRLDNLGAAIRPYLDDYIFLFAGGMALAAAMEQADLHRRLALVIMRAIGTDPRRLLLGVLSSTAFVSLWISNTATAAMMLPIGLAVTKQMEAKAGKRLVFFGAALMLAVAYGANVGGIGTKIGTVPNIVFVGYMQTTYKLTITFFQFLVIGLPFVLIFIPIVWMILWRHAKKDALEKHHEVDIAAELRAMGQMKRAEKLVLAVFGMTALVWILGQPITAFLQSHFWPKMKSSATEGGIAMIAAVLLVVLRAEGRRVLEWKSLMALPWLTLFLLGGGFSMASGVDKSGLGRRLGESLAFLRDMSPLVQLLLSSLATVTLSAVASNVATVQVMLPVLSNAVLPIHRNATLFTCTIASSCDFALPAGTPPNAIVFGSGYLTVPVMAKIGFLLDLLAAVIVAVWCWVIVGHVM